MAKNKTSNNDLFSNFKAPKIDRQKEDNKNSELVPEVDKIEPLNTFEEKKTEDDIQPVRTVDDMAYAMPRSGRPKTLEGKYHIFTARLREDLYEYALSISGRDKDYQSVNDYINRLIAKDMLSK